MYTKLSSKLIGKDLLVGIWLSRLNFVADFFHVMGFWLWLFEHISTSFVHVMVLRVLTKLLL
jgi:hypothetical protein